MKLQGPSETDPTGEIDRQEDRLHGIPAHMIMAADYETSHDLLSVS